jgi:hypothetical protein
MEGPEKECFVLGTSYDRKTATEPGNVTMRLKRYIMNCFESGERKGLLKVTYC